MDVSSTYYVSLIREILLLLDDITSKQVYFPAIDQRIWPKIAIHIDGEVQLPYPVSRMRCNVFV